MLLKGVDFLEAALDTNIQYLSGVGPKRAALYHKLDIHTIRDLLYYFPRAYIDLSSPCFIADAPPWEICADSGACGSKIFPAVCPKRHDHL